MTDIVCRSKIHGEIVEEPGLAFDAPAFGERVFLVVAAGGKERGGGVAKGFAGVIVEVVRQFTLSPFAGPAEFAFDVGREFRCQELFPSVATGVAETDPGEVEEFVGEDPGALGEIIAEAGMKMDFAAADSGAADGWARTVV